MHSRNLVCRRRFQITPLSFSHHGWKQKQQASGMLKMCCGVTRFSLRSQQEQFASINFVPSLSLMDMVLLMVSLTGATLPPGTLPGTLPPTLRYVSLLSLLRVPS